MPKFTRVKWVMTVILLHIIICPLFDIKKVIHEAKPYSRQVVIFIFTHVCPHFSKASEITTDRLLVWPSGGSFIIDDVCLIKSYYFVNNFWYTYPLSSQLIMRFKDSNSFRKHWRERYIFRSLSLKQFLLKICRIKYSFSNVLNPCVWIIFCVMLTLFCMLFLWHLNLFSCSFLFLV